MPELDEKFVGYIKEIESKPLLTKEQEFELAHTIQDRLKVHSKIKSEIRRKKSENKDKILGKAIETLTTHNLRLVIKEAFAFARATGVNVQDLIGSGNLGLIKTAYLYNPEKFNTRFSTYATYWIRQAMFIAVHSSGLITVPIHILNGRFQHNKLIEEGVTNNKTLMRELEVNKEGLKRIKSSNVHVISLDQEVGNDKENGSCSVNTLGDLIPDPKAVDPSQWVSDKDKYVYLHESMDELDDMSRDIVSAQILEQDKTQLSKLGKKYGVTGERIRQIREKALKALRKKIEYKTKLGLKQK